MKDENEEIKPAPSSEEQKHVEWQIEQDLKIWGIAYIQMNSTGEKKRLPPEEMFVKERPTSEAPEEQEELWKQIFHQAGSRMDFMKWLQQNFTVHRKRD